MVLDGIDRTDTEPIVSTTGSAPPSAETIIEAVALALDTKPVELPPLYESVDIDALGRVLTSTTHGSVTFRYQRLRVVAEDDGTVEVYPVPDDE